MKHFLLILKHEPVLAIAAAAAVISCFFVPPDRSYINYIDFRTLALLYALMVVVAGLRKAGLFDQLACTLCSRAKNLRLITLLLVALPFFTAMLITNDVALLTFVPFAVIVLNMAGLGQHLIRIVVLQTVAANLGSMLTPMGNPQNLYLYSYYDYTMADFLKTTFPIWGISALLIAVLCLAARSTAVHVSLPDAAKPDRKELILYLALFIVCLLVVLRLIPWPVMLLIVIAVLLIIDRRMLLRADLMLILTFIAFFIFSGNLARIPAVDQLLRSLLEGRAYLTSLLASQVISNVPAALLLSGFTDQAKSILLGVNVGGLGTPIASLASLISLKLYGHAQGADQKRYLLFFTLINVVLLILLSLICMLL